MSQIFNLAIDLAGENLWYDYDTHYNSASYIPIECSLKICLDVACIGCNGPFKPGCTNNTCPANTINTLANFIFGGRLGQNFIFIYGLLSSCIHTDGFPSFTENDSPLNRLQKITKGIIGLTISNLSLPTQLALKNKLPPNFSLCLPSLNKQGFTNLLVGSIGKVPFQELYKFVQTTPLIVNPISTGAIYVQGVPSIDCFINVKAIKQESQRS
ncbi:probable aspartic proteinase GIP2 [Cicer arietinum]|uniref:Basic 7S globulin 2-like n=1 Tax=Cicer arietinum TaxID=3827 RepID=A0A1S2Z4V7_CICAR|nr:basic 7S globulin 2-like [Cicer arietinum]